MRKTLLILCLVSIMVLGTAGLALAKHTRYGPPVISDDAGTEPKGTWEWGTSTVQTWSPGFYTNTVITALTYGVTDYLEVFVAPEVSKAIWGKDVNQFAGPGTGGDKWFVTGNHGSVSRYGDVWLGAKYQFLEEKGRIPSFAAKFTGKIPTQTASHGMTDTTGRGDYRLTLIGTKSLGRTQLNIDLAYNYKGEATDNDRRVYSNEIRYEASLALPIIRKPASLLVGEIIGRTNYRQEHLTARENILDLWIGLKTKFTKKFATKIGIGERVSAGTPLLGTLGVVYYF